MVRTKVLVLLLGLLLCACSTASKDTPKFGKQVDVPFGWQYTYCPNHSNEIGCQQFNK